MQRTVGLDFTLPGSPPLVDPPLSLPALARSLIDTEGMVEQARVAGERAASALQRIAELSEPGEVIDGATDAVEDAAELLAELRAEYDEANTYANAMLDRVKTLSRWEEGFQYLPELGRDKALSTFANFSGNTKTDGNNQAPASAPFYWYDPVTVVGLDDRSAFGWPNTDYASRALRAERALRGHEQWQVEQAFWSSPDVPTNFHLTASSNTPSTSAVRGGVAFSDPTAAPTTILGTAVGLAQSLAALDQAIADSDGGTGMIHATPYVMQQWMKTYPFIRDPNAPGVYTVNHNLMVPGYGYAGTGPDTASRTVTDGVLNSTTLLTSASAAFTSADVGHPVSGTGIPAGTVIASVTSATNVVLSQAATASASSVHVTIAGTGGDATQSLKQWAYATEMVYTLSGDVHIYPTDIREVSPALPVGNDVPVRAERSWACITNRLLHAAVLIDTTVA